jgi:uncharacterized repeat protein (TIGR01451 family)
VLTLKKVNNKNMKNLHFLKKLLASFLATLTITTFIISGWLIIWPATVQAKLFGDTTANPPILKYKTQTCVVPYQLGNWVKTCALTKFDPADGELRKVRIEVVAGIKANFYIENLDISPSSITMSALAKVKLIDTFSNTQLIGFDADVTKTAALPSYDNILDYGGTSGVTYPNVFGTDKTGSQDFLSTNIAQKPVLDSFTLGLSGTSPDKQINVVSTSSTQGSANMAIKIESFTEIKSINFIYEYFQADVAITTTHSPSVFQENSTGKIKYTIANKDVEATSAGLSFTTTLPSYLTYVSQSNPDWTCTGTTTIKCDSTKPILVGGSADVEFTVNTGTSTPNIYTNNAKLTYGIAEYDLVNNESIHDIPFNHDPVAVNCDLGLHSMASIISLIATKNPCLSGTDPDTHLADSVKKYIIKSLPTATQGVLTDGTNPIAIGQDVTAILSQLKFVSAPTYIGNFSFDYTVYDSYNMFDKTDATVTGQIYENDLAIDKQSQSPNLFNVGQEFEYTIKVTNTKITPIIAVDTKMVDIIPSQLSFVAVTTIPIGWACNFVTPTLTCTKITDFTSNQVADFKVKVKVNDTTDNTIINKAIVTTDAKELNLANNEDSDTAGINHPPVAYDCDLGSRQQGLAINPISSVKSDCLKGTDPDPNDSITKFIIKSLVDPLAGSLTLNGVPVIIGQSILPSDVNNMVFTPVSSFVGPYSFTYTVEDSKGLQDLTPATVKGVYDPSDFVPEKQLTTGDTIFIPGTTKTYTLKVINSKQTPVIGKIVMIDTLPSTLSYLSHTAPSGWICTNTTQELKCEITKTFAPSEVNQFTVTVKTSDTMTPIIKNIFKIIPEFPQVTTNDEVFVENPGNNPPVAYDCDLGKHTAGQILDIALINTTCLKGTDPDNDAIVKYVITTLPSSNTVELQLLGVKVVSGQALSQADLANLKVVPINSYEGLFEFLYTVEEARGLIDLTPAKVIGEYLGLDVQIDKKASVGVIELNSPFDYIFTLSNKGYIDMPNLIVTDILPSNLEYISFDAPEYSCSYDILTREFSCTKNAILAIGDTSIIKLKTKLINQDVDIINNTVKVSCSQGEKNCANNEDVDQTPIAKYDIAIIKKHQGVFKLNQKGFYNFEVANLTNYQHPTKIVLDDTLPIGLSISSIVAPSTDWDCQTLNSRQLTCTKANGMLPMQKDLISLVVEVKSDAPSKIINTATITTPTKETDLTNNTSTDQLEIPKEELVRTGGQNNTGIYIAMIITGISVVLITYIYTKKTKKE